MRIYARAVVIAARDIPDNLTEEQIEEAKSNLESELNLDMDNLHCGADPDTEYDYEQRTEQFEPSKEADWTDEILLSYLNDKLNNALMAKEEEN